MDLGFGGSEEAEMPPDPDQPLKPVFDGILFARPEDRPTSGVPETPAFVTDLNLDQIIRTIVGDGDEHGLRQYFDGPLTGIDAIHYRHEVFRDLEKPSVLECVRSFVERMGSMNEQLMEAEKLFNRHQKQAWFLEAIETYSEALDHFVGRLAAADLESRGLAALRDYLGHYLASDRFTRLVAEAKRLRSDLATVSYCLNIKSDRITVRKYDAEPDFAAGILAVFEKFKQDDARDYKVKLPETVRMNRVEAGILDLVARLYPDLFSALDAFCGSNAAYLDPTVAAFEREVHFYLSYLEHVERFRAAGLSFCYPEVSATSKEVSCSNAFDMALAHRLLAEAAPVVCNDFHLDGAERIFVVSGPNQGGKTTFARTFGQLHFLASIGCPVPGENARLYLFDGLFTHFEREEDIENLRGKLEDDLIRTHQLLNAATPNSIVILNEIFASTSLKDATFLSEKVLNRIIELDLLCVWVTFIDELGTLSHKTVSLVSTVVPEDPAMRTYKIVRRAADGLAYAALLAEKHGLTYRRLVERIKP